MVLGINGYWGVEFYFIISGVFLAKSVEKKISEKHDWTIKDVYSTIIEKYIYYIRYYAIALLLLIVRDLILGERIKGIIFKLLCSIPQFLMLGQLGFNNSDFNSYGYYVSGSWYLSVLFILFCFFFPMMIWNYKVFMNSIVPIMFCLSFSCLLTNYGKVSVAFEPFIVGHAGLLRGVCELCMGCIIYEISKLIRKSTISKMAEIAMYVIIIIFMCININNIMQFSMLFITAVGVLCTLVNDLHGQGVYHNVFCFLGRISFPLLYLHEPIRLIVNIYINDKVANRIAFYSISFIASILAMKIVSDFKFKKVMRI